MTAIRTIEPVRPWGRLRMAGREHAAPAVFLASVALFATLSCASRIAPFHPFGVLAFFDLKVYRACAGAVLDGRPLYDIRFPGNLAFTYPPFAALALVPLRLVPVGVDEVGATVVNATLLLAIARWTLALPSASRRLDPRRATQIAWLAAALGLWTEPVNTAIGYGQIDLLIAALVLVDLSRATGTRGRGAAIGLAAGLKLTPLIFVVYLAITGQLRAARNAALTFAATVATGLLLLPGDSVTYWAGGFLDLSHVSGRPDAGGGPANQSLRGMLLRVLPRLPDHTAAWLVLAALVACLGLVLAARAARRGEHGTGYVLCALTGLLVSPISWTHQWTLAVPGLLLLVLAPRTRRGRVLAFAATVAFAAFSYVIWFIIHAHPLGLELSTFEQLAGNLYVLTALAVLVVVAAREIVASRRPASQVAIASALTP